MPVFKFVLLCISVSCWISSFGQGFTEIAPEAGIDHIGYDTGFLAGTGLAFFDMDNDGDEDLYLIGGLASDKLYENDGTGHFKDITQQAGLAFTAQIATNGIVAGDINNDGYRDLCITTLNGYPIILLHNNGNKTFTNIARQAGFTTSHWSMAASFGDYNADGLLDLFIGNYIRNKGDRFRVIKDGAEQNQLYRNLGDLQFEEVSENSPFTSQSATLVTAFTDVDGDRDLDLFVGNDFGPTYGSNRLYLNESGVFEDVSQITNTDREVYAMGIGIGDIKNNGSLSYYITNDGANLMHVKRRRGLWYDDRAIHSGIELAQYTSWGAVFFDFNNDMYLDLAVANGAYLTDTFQPTILYQGNGQGGFEDVSLFQNITESTSGRGLATADIDNDGDLDFAVAVNYNQPSTDQVRFLLYRNDNPKRHWLKVKLQGTRSNSDGLGAHVKIVAGEERMLREISGGGHSYLSHSSIVAHFGLADATIVDSLIVDWIGGKQQVFTGIPVNQFVTIREDQPSNQSIDITICEFDSVLHANRYIKKAGNYYDTLVSEEYDLHRVVETRLHVQEVEKDTVDVYLKKGERFDDIKIESDTTVVKTQKLTSSCPEATIYQIHLGQMLSLSTFPTQEMKVAPNPVTHTLNIKNYDHTPWEITDLTGKVFMKGTYPSVKVGNLRCGMYVIRMGGKAYRFIKK